MPDFDFLYSLENSIATITLNRPDVLNALTLRVYAQLRDLMEDLRMDEAVKVVVITGAGRGFCAGGDVHEIIGEVLKWDMKGHLEFTRMTGALVHNMRRLDKPIIAAVNGTCAGAGAVIALACDLRVMAAGAKMAFLFSKVGLTGADMGAAYLLPRVVGMARATELLMLGDAIPAERAEEIGLVNKVVPVEQVLPAAMEWAQRLAAGAALALGMTKRMLVNEWSMDLASALEAEAQAQALMMMGADHRIFYEAFKEKAEAKFTRK